MIRTLRFVTRSLSTHKSEEIIIQGLKPLEPLPSLSIGQFFFDKLSKACSKDSEPILINAANSEQISRNEILSRSVSLAQSLQNCGFGKDSLVAVCSNSVNFVVSILASLYSGVPVAFVNPALTCVEKRHCLNISKPELVIISKSVHSEFVTMKKKVLVDDSTGSDSVEHFVQEYQSNDNYCNLVQIEPDEDVALVLFTAGTTGPPKAVSVTHSNISAELQNLSDSRFYDQLKKGPILGAKLFCHSYGLLSILNDITNGLQVILVPRYDAEVLLGTIEAYKIVQIWVGRFFFRTLIESSAVSKYNLESLREIGSTANFVCPCLEHKLRKKFPNLRIIRQAYGLTELTSGVFVMDYERVIYGSCGKLVPNMYCKVLDLQSGESLGPYKAGELCFKGPLVTKGYYKNPEATNKVFTPDGWFLTGDIGYYDDDQYFYFVERIQDVITYQNQQVPPALVEKILISHPEIEDAGVVALGSEQLPVGFVVKKHSSRLCEDDVREFVRVNLPENLRLRKDVKFITKIPRSSFGKIQRHELRKILKSL